MKKNIFLILFAYLPLLMMGQGIGINPSGAAPDNSAGLDVNFTDRGFLPPRVALTAANAAGPITSPATGLIVYNTATAGTGQNAVWPGLYYNAGTPAAPLWVRFDGRMLFHSSSTSAITLNTNGSVTLIPGTAITFTIPAGKIADVYIYAYSGAALTGGSSTSWAVADVIIYKNGTFLPVGGWNRIKLNNRDGTTTDMNTTSLICIDRNVTAGTYTYDLRGNRFSGNQGVSVGGDCTAEVNCAEMTIEVVFKN